MQQSERELIDAYIAKHGVKKVPPATFSPRPPESRQARIVRERHERKRQEYRELINQGLHVSEIARLMGVSRAQVRKVANAIGLIDKLRGIRHG